MTSAITADAVRERDPVRDQLHDLRNLFGVVTSGTHLLGDRQPPEREAIVLQAIDGAATRGAEILSALLAGLGAGEPKICRLPERLAQLAPILTTMAGEGIHLRLDLTARVATSACRPEQLDRVVIELVANARRAVENDGRIEIRVRHALGRIWIVVADTGTGMRPDQLERLRRAPCATAGGANGTGLGQVQAFVSDVGGRLRVRSRLGRGTTIAMILPTIADPNAATDNCE